LLLFHVVREFLYHATILYIDDVLDAGSSMKEIINFKARLAEDFSIKDLDIAKKILRMKISREKQDY